jgi:hypothetical protein
MEDYSRSVPAERDHACRHLVENRAKENRSVRRSRSLPFACSGDIYATVPIADPGLVRFSSLTLAAVTLNAASAEVAAVWSGRPA